jgi:tRNA G18 (ribose-2'-O)-methylase SpoU
VQSEHRRQIGTPGEIEAALTREDPVRLLLAREGTLSPDANRVIARCRAAGIPIRTAGEREMKRMAIAAEREVIALVGSDPAASLDQVLAGSGALWLLAGVAYPGNAGFAIRTAEVSGAAGIALDAPFDHAARRQALRASMRADRFFPVLWAESETVLARAKALDRRLVAIEDHGAVAPWETDLTGAAVFVVGGEAGGVSASLLEACDVTVRIPMTGFVPSYNLQAAMAIVAGERLRQISASLRPLR